MLILAPANSAATGLEEQLEILRQVKGAKLVVVHGAGHEVYAEKTEACLDAFKEFLFDLDLRVSADVA